MLPPLDDRLPAEQQLHALEQRLDAARPLVGDRRVAAERERELLVLGADPVLRLRLTARFQPRDEFVARFDRRHVDLVAGHAGKIPGREEGADHTQPARLRAMWIGPPRRPVKLADG